jgi:hypothetical protein
MLLFVSFVCIDCTRSDLSHRCAFLFFQLLVHRHFVFFSRILLLSTFASCCAPALPLSQADEREASWLQPKPFKHTRNKMLLNLNNESLSKELKTLFKNSKHSTVTIGRLDTNVLVLDHNILQFPTPIVSRYHALLKVDRASRQLVIRDIGGTNGTYVNQSHVRGGWNALREDDVISFGG